MTLWLVVIAILLIMILCALERGNSIRAAQADAERERYEMERLEAEEQREYDAFFAIKGYPHRRDNSRIPAWASQRGMTTQEAQDALLNGEVDEQISRTLAESNKKRIENLRQHGWHADYVALAFTPEQRSGEDFRPIHGMIWKDDEKERYFLPLTVLTAFSDGDCSPEFPLRSKSTPPESFTIEKKQKYEWSKEQQKLILVDVN